MSHHPRWPRPGHRCLEEGRGQRCDCAERRLDPLAALRPQVELYVRWMQEVRRLKPATTSRRMSIVAGFYRTAVIDGLLEYSPAEHVRRPHVSAESPTLGLTHLQLEALLAAARDSDNRYDFCAASAH
jgi:integrase/recombinase XerD